MRWMWCNCLWHEMKWGDDVLNISMNYCEDNSNTYTHTKCIYCQRVVCIKSLNTIAPFTIILMMTLLMFNASTAPLLNNMFCFRWSHLGWAGTRGHIYCFTIEQKSKSSRIIKMKMWRSEKGFWINSGFYLRWSCHIYPYLLQHIVIIIFIASASTTFSYS